MISFRLTRSVLILASIAAFLTTGTLGGCTRLRASQAVTVENLQNVSNDGLPLALDVQNARGTVSIWVDPTKPLAVWAAVKGGSGSDHKPDWIAASVVQDNGRPVLRVLSSAAADQPKPTTIRIRVPSCAGLRVRNAGGLIDVKGVTGAIDIQNAMDFGTPEAVRVVAGAPITAPIGVHTNFGNISVRLPLGSTGTARVYSLEGQSLIDGAKTTLTEVLTNRTQITCVIMGGTNAIDIGTDKGVAQLVIDD